MQSTTVKEIEVRLIKETGAYVLSPVRVSKIIDKSCSTLERWRKKGLYLSYRKVGDAKNAPTEYTVETVAEYIVNHHKNIMI